MKTKVIVGIMLLLLLTSMFALAFNIKTVKASGTIYIRSDGSIDPPTAPIQRDGDIYTFTDNIYDEIVIQKSNIILDGDGYTLEGTQSGTGIYQSGIQNVTIRNIQIRAFDFGINLRSCSDCTIDGNFIANNGRGIYFNDGSANNTLSGNTVSESTWDGIWLFGSSSNIISSNNVTNNGYRGITLQDSSNNNNMSRNNVSSSTYDGIGIFNSYGNTVSENTVLKCPCNGIVVHRSSNNTIYGNNITANANASDPATGVYCGIYLYEASFNDVYENYVTDNYGDGITQVNSSYNNIYGNSLTDNAYFGIWFYETSISNVYGNHIAYNEEYGVAFSAFSSNNSVYRNHIISNAYGIYFENSFYNTISENYIAHNQVYGIFIGSSSSNTHYHNNFVGNPGAQVLIFDSGLPNILDYGYPYGGNYWSDYTGSDSDGDGIGDTPYIIDADNQDNYPLMNPWTPLTGDFDGDRDVDWFDFGTFAQAYGTSIGQPRYHVRCDLDQDSDIDWFDFWNLCRKLWKISLVKHIQ